MENLPIPIIGLIFQNLDFKQILKSRLVSKQTNNLIKKSMHFYHIVYKNQEMDDAQIDLITDAKLDIQTGYDVNHNITRKLINKCKNIKKFSIMVSNKELPILEELVMNKHKIDKLHVCSYLYDETLSQLLSQIDAAKIKLNFIQAYYKLPLSSERTPENMFKYLDNIIDKCTTNRISQLEISDSVLPCKSILRLLKNNPGLEKISLSVLTQNIVPLVEYLANEHQSNIIIDLSAMKLNRNIFNLLCNKKSGCIEEINLCWNNYLDIDIDEICNLLINQKNGCIKKIKINSDVLTDLGLYHLSNQTKAIESISIEGSEKITDIGLGYLAQTNIKKLKIAHSHITATGLHNFYKKTGCLVNIHCYYAVSACDQCYDQDMRLRTNNTFKQEKFYRIKSQDNVQLQRIKRKNRIKSQDNVQLQRIKRKNRIKSTSYLKPILAGIFMTIFILSLVISKYVYTSN